MKAAENPLPVRTSVPQELKLRNWSSIQMRLQYGNLCQKQDGIYMKKSNKIILSFLTAAFLFVTAAGFIHNPHKKEHYDVRKDLSVYFTNSDDVIYSVRSQLKRRRKNITIEYSSHSNNMEDIDKLVKEIMDYAYSETKFPDEGDYLFFQSGGYNVKFSLTEHNGIFDYRINILPEYYSTAGQEEKVDKEVRRIIDDFGFDSNTSDYEKIASVYDYLCKNVDYDIIHKKNSHYHLKSTAYGALINKHAACQGYAVAMYRLLRECDVNCRIITGMASSESGEEYHAWNIAEIDGSYYDLDPAWDSGNDEYKYFLKCENDFKDHIRDTKYLSEDFAHKYPMSSENYEEIV